MKTIAPATTTPSDRARLRRAFILLQVASVIWVVKAAYFASIEWLGHFTPLVVTGRIAVPLFEWLEFLAIGLLLFALYLLSRRLDRLLPFVAGWLVFLCTFLAFLGSARAGLDRLWMSITGEPLLVANPFVPLWQAFPRLLWEPLLLCLLLGGFVLAREVNRMHGGGLVKDRRLVILLALAIGALALSGRYLGRYILQFIDWTLDPGGPADAGLDAMIHAVTIARWIMLLPGIAFHILFFVTLEAAKKRLRIPAGMEPCEHCGYPLAAGARDRCPECGRQGASRTG